MKEAALKKEITKAVKHFWTVRNKQAKKQRAKGVSDAGSRSSVTGGKQMAGFEDLAATVITDSGISASCIYRDTKLELPGYYRAEKKWDLLVIDEGKLILAVEFKSQVGSFGNNFNNRSEEAIGTATDLWVAFREKAFKKQKFRPWLGYFFLLQSHKKSLSPLGVREPHFKVFPEFKDASYAKRYELLMNRLLLERQYDAASLLLSDESKMTVEIANEDLSALNFFKHLRARCISYVETGM